MNHRDYKKFKKFYLTGSSNELTINNNSVEPITQETRMESIKTAFRIFGIDFLTTDFCPQDYRDYANSNFRQLARTRHIFRNAALGRYLQTNELQYVLEINSAKDLINELTDEELNNCLSHYHNAEYNRHAHGNVEYHTFMTEFNAYLVYRNMY